MAPRIHTGHCICHLYRSTDGEPCFCGAGDIGMTGPDSRPTPYQKESPTMRPTTLTKTSIGVQTGQVQTTTQRYDASAVNSTSVSIQPSPAEQELLDCGFPKDLAWRAVAGRAASPYPPVPAEPQGGGEQAFVRQVSETTGWPARVSLWYVRWYAAVYDGKTPNIAHKPDPR
jgi:hypothetical protein